MHPVLQSQAASLGVGGKLEPRCQPPGRIHRYERPQVVFLLPYEEHHGEPIGVVHSGGDDRRVGQGYVAVGQTELVSREFPDGALNEGDPLVLGGHIY